MEAVYDSLLRWGRENYVTWSPDYLKHMRIRYGNRLSGDWPPHGLRQSTGGADESHGYRCE